MTCGLVVYDPFRLPIARLTIRYCQQNLRVKNRKEKCILSIYIYISIFSSKNLTCLTDISSIEIDVVVLEKGDIQETLLV